MFRNRKSEIGVSRKSPVVEHTLDACHEVLGTAVPKPFAARALPAGIWLSPAPLLAFSMLRGAMIHCHLLRGVWERLRCVGELRFVAPSAEHDLILLPSSFSFLYYLVRPVRLSWKRAWRLLHAMLRRNRRLVARLKSGHTGSAVSARQAT